MTVRTVTVGSLPYRFASDDPLPVAECVWSVAAGRAVDEITGDPVSVMTVGVVEGELDAKTGSGGTYTLIARPRRRFPPLAAASYVVHLTVEAEGYLPATQPITIPTYQRQIVAPGPAVGASVVTLDSNAGLVASQGLLIGPAGANEERLAVANVGPGANQVTLGAPLVYPHLVGAPVAADEFTPVAVADVAMRRRPVTISGRAVRRDAGGTGFTAVANASIAVTGVWRTTADVRQHLAPVAANLVSLAPGLYRARTAGATLAAQDLPIVPGDDKLLTGAVSAGAAAAGISNRRNLVAPPSPPPHSVLRVDADNPDCAEYLGINALAGLGTVDEPGRVTFDYPLSLAHCRGARVQRTAPQPAAAAVPFTDAGDAGDVCVFVTSIAGLAASGTVVIAGGAVPPEFQWARTFSVVSDADGYFALPPLSRVAQIRIGASAAGLTPLTIDFQPDYSQRENRVDIVFA